MSLHYNEGKKFLLVNVVKIYQFKETGMYGYIYNFSVDYDSIHVNDFSGIRKYINKMHDMK